jgi:hypothetical protein
VAGFEVTGEERPAGFLIKRKELIANSGGNKVKIDEEFEPRVAAFDSTMSGRF